MKNLREAIDYVTEYEAEFVQEAADSRLRERDAEFSRKRETLSKAESRIAELDNLFKHLYLFCCLRLPAGFPALNGPQQSFALPQAQQSEYRRRNA